MNDALNIKIDKLLALGYELEGLLVLARTRGVATPSEVWHMISEKATVIRSSVDMLATELTPSQDEKNDAVDGADDSAGVVADDSADDVVVDGAATVSYSALPHVQEVESPVAAETVFYSGEGHADDEPQAEADTIHDIDDDGVSSTMDMSTDTPIRLDEKLAREGSRNLRKAFSINDRFRFRRELFGNSDIEMSDTLNLVEAMTTYPEAVDYFMTDLQWDADNPEVKDFMAIIEKHFATR